jgi:hypothetical protein
MKKINVKCFWKGSVMFDMTMTKKEYNNLVVQLQKDFFRDAEDTIENAIEVLNWNEASYYEEYQKNGKYFIDDNDMVIYLLMINSLIKRGLAKNDDKTGLLIYTIC